jgi:hypothetical protein
MKPAGRMVALFPMLLTGSAALLACKTTVHAASRGCALTMSAERAPPPRSSAAALNVKRATHSVKRTKPNGVSTPELDDRVVVAARDALALDRKREGGQPAPGTAVPIIIDDSLAAPAADAVLRAVASVDRGIAATPADAAAIDSAVQVFESVAPCALSDAELAAYLCGRWRLAYSSSLVSSSAADYLGSGAEAEAWRRLAATLVASPTARSRRVALGDVRLRVAGEGGALTVDEEVALQWRVPWPLPAAPALRLRFASGLAVRGAQVIATPTEVGASVEGLGGGGGGGGAGAGGGGAGGAAPIELPWKLPAAEMRRALDEALARNQQLAQLPASRALLKLRAAAHTRNVTALSGAVPRPVESP